jgi:hypothetical protein
MADTIQSAGRGASPILIALAWALVSVPWVWGFIKTLENAVKLFG